MNEPWTRGQGEIRSPRKTQPPINFGEPMETGGMSIAHPLPINPMAAQAVLAGDMKGSQSGSQSPSIPIRQNKKP